MDRTVRRRARHGAVRLAGAGPGQAGRRQDRRVLTRARDDRVRHGHGAVRGRHHRCDADGADRRPRCRCPSRSDRCARSSSAPVVPNPEERYDATALGRALSGTAERLPRPAPAPAGPAVAVDQRHARPHDDEARGVERDDADHRSRQRRAATRSRSTSTARRRRSRRRAKLSKAVKAKADKPRKRWRRRLLLGITALVLLLAGGAAVYAATQATVPKHDVPGVVGMTADQALAQVGEFGWKIDRQDQYDDTTAAGQVIRQDPPPGSTLKEGATFALVVSRGPTPVAVPDLTGHERRPSGRGLEDRRPRRGHTGDRGLRRERARAFRRQLGPDGHRTCPRARP